MSQLTAFRESYAPSTAAYRAGEQSEKRRKRRVEVAQGGAQAGSEPTCEPASKRRRGLPADLVAAPACGQPQLRLMHLDTLLSGADAPAQRFWERARDMSQQMVSVGATAAAGWAASKLLSGSDSSILASSTLGNVLGTQVGALLGHMAYGQNNRAATLRQRVLRRLQHETAQQTPPLSLHTCTALAKVDLAIEAQLKCGHSEISDLLLRRREGILRCVPTQVVDVSHQHVGGNPALRRKIDVAVEALIGEYGAEHGPTLRAFIQQVRTNCFTKRPSRAQLYLQGPPGTGKTRFAQRLADTLGLPLLNIPCKKGSNLLGEGRSQYDFQRSDVPDKDLLGDVGWAFLQAGCINPIVFIDEAGDQLEQFEVKQTLKLLLDPDRKALTWNAVSDLSLDFSRATVVMTGNVAMSDPALRSRVPQLMFGALPRQHKDSVLRAYVAELLDDNAVLEPEVAAAVEAGTAAAVEVILNVDAAQQVAGVRTAQEVARQVVNALRDAALRGTALSQEALQALVVQAFESH